MGRVLAIGTLTLVLGGCGLTGSGRWAAWEQAERQPLGRGVMGAPEQVIENRVRWFGPDDLHAEILMTLTAADQLSVVARIIDDRPLQQSRTPSVHPAWWLERVGCDAMEVVVGEGEDEFSVIAALGSAGFDPTVIQGEGEDAVAVWPTPTGANVQMTIDLGARGLLVTDVEDHVRVRIHDVDGPGNWSVNEVSLR